MAWIGRFPQVSVDRAPARSLRVTTPAYLRIFLPATPQNHRSPPCAS